MKRLANSRNRLQQDRIARPPISDSVATEDVARAQQPQQEVGATGAA